MGFLKLATDVIATHIKCAATAAFDSFNHGEGAPSECSDAQKETAKDYGAVANGFISDCVDNKVACALSFVGPGLIAKLARGARIFGLISHAGEEVSAADEAAGAGRETATSATSVHPSPGSAELPSGVRAAPVRGVPDSVPDSEVGVGAAARNARPFLQPALNDEEYAQVQRLTANPRFADRIFSPSEDPANDIVDEFGKAYELTGGPNAAAYWEQNGFLEQLQRHLQFKHADYLVIDYTGFSMDQVQAAERVLAGGYGPNIGSVVRIGP